TTGATSPGRRSTHTPATWGPSRQPHSASHHTQPRHWPTRNRPPDRAGPDIAPAATPPADGWAPRPPGAAPTRQRGRLGAVTSLRGRAASRGRTAGRPSRVA